jgi:IS30 family transposase
VSSASIKKFFWQNITCHCGVPRHITVDNAKYFDNAMFRDFCKQIGMKVAFTLVYHPQSNGTVERANSLIFKAIKKILEGEKKENGQRSSNRSVDPQHYSVQSNKLYTF